MKKQKTEPSLVAAEVRGYTKGELLQAQRFAADSDLLTAVLREEGSYSLDEVETLLKRYKERTI